MTTAPDPRTLEEKLRAQLDTTTWRDLRTHVARGAVFSIAPALDIVAVAIAVAEDDTEQVRAWLDANELSRPSAETMAIWERSLDAAMFRCLVVAPYVLIQRVTDA